MNKHIKVSLVLLSLIGMAYADHSNKAFANSKTFFWIRPPFQTAMPEKETLFRDRALAKECGWSGAFQVVGFGGQSTHSKDMAEYFMFCTKSELIVASNNLAELADNPNARDVNAAHFNILAQTTGDPFKSTFKFRPRHTFYGAGFEYRQYLHCKDACEKYWWFDISFPVLYVRNDMRLTEVVTSGTPLNANVNANMVEAFKGAKGFFNPSTATVTGTAWTYGKIDGARKKTGVADIEVKLGYDFICDDCCHAEAYIGGLIPTGNRPKAHFVFEPIIGHNKHGGIMWGGSWGWQIWENCDSYLHVEMAANGRYLFQGKEWRSFDVKGKPWSRYMLVYLDADDAASQAATTGINVFTRKLKVTPRFMHDLNTALVYTWCNFQAEVGYNFWAKTSEKIRLDSAWEVGPAFASLADSGATNGANAINRAITIKENFSACEADYSTLQAIQEQDLDLLSASSPALISHTFYGSVGYRWDDWCYPVFAGFGGSYEFASEHGAINRWMLWGKVGFSI